MQSNLLISQVPYALEVGNTCEFPKSLLNFARGFKKNLNVANFKFGMNVVFYS